MGVHPLRNSVKRELGLETQALQQHGTNRHESAQLRGGDISPPLSGATTEIIRGTSKEYILARLKRDARDIADLVIDGQITAAEGYRRLQERQKGRAVKRVTFTK